MMEEFVAFETVVYKAEITSIENNGVNCEILKTLDVVCDQYIKEAKQIAQDNLDKRYKKFGKEVGDQGSTYHSTNELIDDTQFQTFNKFVLKTAENIQILKDLT